MVCFVGVALAAVVKVAVVVTGVVGVDVAISRVCTCLDRTFVLRRAVMWFLGSGMKSIQNQHFFSVVAKGPFEFFV